MVVQDETIAYGWTGIPRDPKVLLDHKPKLFDPKPVLISENPFPSSTLVQHVQAYAKSELQEQTYNHSMRVYYYGSFPLL